MAYVCYFYLFTTILLIRGTVNVMLFAMMFQSSLYIYTMEQCIATTACPIKFTIRIVCIVWFFVFRIYDRAGSPPSAMRATLQFLRERYGSVEGYLISIGFGKEKQRILRDLLLAPVD